MATIANDLKKIQRILSLIVRAIERCFDKPDILYAECGYSYGVYSMKLSANIINDSVLDIGFDVDIENENSKKCITIFFGEVSNAIGKAIDEIDAEEKKISKDIKEYGESYSESVIVQQSSILMFKQIFSSLKRNT